MSTTKTCASCPSFLGVFEARTAFGDDATTPMCARFGRILANPEDLSEGAQKRVQIFIGTSCSSHGLDRPPDPPKLGSSSVWTPDLDLLEPPPEVPAVLDSCRDCRNFEEGEITVALGDGDVAYERVKRCGAQGLLLLDRDLTTRQIDCTWAQRRELGVLVPFPTRKMLGSYTDGVTLAPPATPPRPKKPATPDFVEGEPSEYATDVKVSDEDSHRFAAWRRVISPFDGMELFLPVFRTDYFSPEEQALIPKTGSDAHPELYVDHAHLLWEFAAQSYSCDFTLTLVGEPGSGKTEGVRWLAWMLNMPFVRLGFTGYSEPEQFLGMYQASPERGTYLEPGFLPERWTREGFLLSDEFNTAPEEIVQSYRSMNDSSRMLHIYREVFWRHDYCFHLMAVNPDWDFRNIGAKPLSDADTSRLSFMWMPQPDEKLLRKIIAGSVAKISGHEMDPDKLEQILAIGKDMRASSEQGTLSRSWTPRQEVKVGLLARYYPLDIAYRRALLDFISPAEQEVALTFIKSHIA